jgi:hypothetical protein
MQEWPGRAQISSTTIVPTDDVCFVFKEVMELRLAGANGALVFAEQTGYRSQV